jgi:hypothetical protein
MAYMNQERKAKIAAALKPILAKYKMKGSLSVRNGRTIALHLSQGPIDFIGDMNAERDTLLGFGPIDKEKLREAYTLDINTYWYHEHYTGTAREFLNEVFPAMRSANWYDKSDIQSDYFDVAYHIDVNVGKWKKPYTLVK